MQSTDKELLDFGHDSEDELDSDEEEGEEQEEEREAAGAGEAPQECHRLGRLHAATHSLLSKLQVRPYPARTAWQETLQHTTVCSCLPALLAALQAPVLLQPRSSAAA